MLLSHAKDVLGTAADIMSMHGRPKILKGTRKGGDGNTYYEFSPACRLGVKLAGKWTSVMSNSAGIIAQQLIF